VSDREPVRWPPPCFWASAAAIGYDELLARGERGRVRVRFRFPDGRETGGTMDGGAMTPEAVLDTILPRFAARCSELEAG
jgi:hypothetical protein